MTDIGRRGFLLTGAAALAPSLRGATPEGLPFRQVHLDFHTSELIPGVGSEFDAREFAATLKKARVHSINVFAKCHHGWAYYDTKIAHRHPTLKFDLLGQMVSALRAEKIHVLAYYSLVWDVRVARAHPEWRMLDAQGKVIGGQPGDAWPWICMNTPYLDQVARENEEIAAKYDLDGLWFDILKQPNEGCFCKWCVAERKQLGLSDSLADVARHNKLVALRVEKRLNEVMRKRFPQGLIFFNSRLVIGVRDELDQYSHIEIESLPTGGWGYSHFQQRVRYMRTLGKPMVGMTGRFHKSWGDFGGLKNQAALDFECLNFLANGTVCCVGDQLHPRGRLDASTYERIGRTYEKIEALEPWSRGARAVAEIGVISSAPFAPQSTQKIPPVDQGFTNLLLELHRQFNVLDVEEDFAKYRMIIVPDEIPAHPKLLEKLERFRAGGGAVLVTGASLLDGNRFAWPALGVQYEGPAPFKAAYLHAAPGALPRLQGNSHFLYQPGLQVVAQPGTESLAHFAYPYFDRSENAFSSHKQTPPDKVSKDPLITLNGRVAYIAFPLFRGYSQDGVPAWKQIAASLLDRLLPGAAVEAPGLPSTALLTVLEQPAAPRRIVHVLYYPATRRAPDIDIIEEPGVLVDQELRLRLPRAPRAVKLVPQELSLPFRYENGYAQVRVGRITGHQAICFES